MPRLDKSQTVRYYILKNGMNQLKAYGILQPQQVLDTIFIIDPYDDKAEWLSDLELLGIPSETLESL